MSSAVAGHVRAFGEDVVPVDYTDVEQADLHRAGGLEPRLVPSGADAAHPVAERERRPELKLVVVDPRRTASCDGADLHLPLRPGTDVMLFNGLLAWLAGQRPCG